MRYIFLQVMKLMENTSTGRYRRNFIGNLFDVFLVTDFEYDAFDIKILIYNQFFLIFIHRYGKKWIFLTAIKYSFNTN